MTSSNAMAASSTSPRSTTHGQRRARPAGYCGCARDTSPTAASSSRTMPPVVPAIGSATSFPRGSGCRRGDICASTDRRGQRHHPRLDRSIPDLPPRICERTDPCGVRQGAPRGDLAAVRRQVDVGVDGFPGVVVIDSPTYAGAQAVKAEGPIALVQALAGLSIVVAPLGVGNCRLSVVERVWELGLLDVLGMTRLRSRSRCSGRPCSSRSRASCSALVPVSCRSRTRASREPARLHAPLGSGRDHRGGGRPGRGAAFAAATIPARRAARLSEVTSQRAGFS